MQRSATEAILAEVDEMFAVKTASARRAPAAPAVTDDVTQLVEKLAAAADSLESGSPVIEATPVPLEKQAEQRVFDKLAEAQVLSFTLAALSPEVLPRMVDFVKQAAARGHNPDEAMKFFLEQQAKRS